MKIHVAHNGEKLGPFSPEEISNKLAAGELHRSDLAWYEGAPDWLPILSLPDLKPLASTVPPIPPIPAIPAIPAIPPIPTISSHRSATQMPISPLAIASMVLGIVSLSVFPLLPGIPAVICGHLSLKEIRRSTGAIGGRGLAIAGLVTGYMSVAIMVLLLVAVLGFVGFASTHAVQHSAPESEVHGSHSADDSIEAETPTPSSPSGH